MPFDGKIADYLDPKTFSPIKKLEHLANFMETLEEEQVIMEQVHCGSSHCAWGWGEMIGLFDKDNGNNIGSNSYNIEDASSQCGHSNVLGLSESQFKYCFGSGSQLHYLRRQPLIHDVARHLRNTADELRIAGGV